jgi:hypothetical protein
MAVPRQPSGPPNNLALCVPALARAGQILCTVVTPALARESLRQAAAVLEGNGRFSNVSAVKELVERCRAAAESTDEAQLVPRCRQLAAATARQVTALAQEIQQQAKGQARPAPALAPAPAETPRPVEPARPVVEARPAEPPEPVKAPVPVKKPAPAEKPKAAEPAKPAPPARPAPVAKPEPARAAKAPEKTRPVEPSRPVERPRPAAKPQPAPHVQVPPGLAERITLAQTPAEKSAVALALQNANRFALVGNGSLIDTKTNLMWTTRVGPAAAYGAAQRQVQTLRLGNYTNWRLPTPDELKRLLADEGYDFARSSGMFAAEKGRGGVDQVWTSESRLRFWFFGREVTCLSVHTGGFARRKPADTGIAALAVRSA